MREEEESRLESVTARAPECLCDCWSCQCSQAFTRLRDGLLRDRPKIEGQCGSGGERSGPRSAGGDQAHFAPTGAGRVVFPQRSQISTGEQQQTFAHKLEQTDWMPSQRSLLVKTWSAYSAAIYKDRDIPMEAQRARNLKRKSKK